MRLRRILIPALVILIMSACSKKSDLEESLHGRIGEVEIVLTADPSSVPVSRGTGPLPSVDDFNIEIFKADGIRLYRERYAKAKGETINLNAGEYRLVASHGDALGFGFDRPYYLADRSFAVHGWKDNDGKPDRVSAVAKMANVGVSVAYGPNLLSGYSDCYTLVRHARYADKSLKFGRDETRTGYLPGGDIFLEVFARTAPDSLVFFRSEMYTFAPNDKVTLHVDTEKGRPGALALTLLVDRSTEQIEKRCLIPASAVPAGPPQFAFAGAVGRDFTVRFTAGLPVSPQNSVLGIFASKGIAGMSLETKGVSGVPLMLDLLHLSASDRAALTGAGLVWRTPPASRVGSLDFSQLIPALVENAVHNPADPVIATFTLNVTDRDGESASATLRIATEPVLATLSVPAGAIWGWKVVAPKATLADLTHIPEGTLVKLQYSPDGSAWKTVPAALVHGNEVTFPDVTGLTPGRTYQFRTLVGNQAGAPVSFRTEEALQVDNAGFEEYSRHQFTTKITFWFSSYTVDWWQLHDPAKEAWWAVNSPLTLNSQVALGYQDFKSFPTVSLTGQDPASGNTSAIVASIAIDDVASLIVSGNARTGELFLGKANDRNEGDWAKVSEGHAFGSRPAALSFRYKFDANGEDPFSATVQVLDADGAVIGSGKIDSVRSSVPAWTLCSVPVRYSVTDRKASSLRISFRSSATDSKDSRSVTLHTLSGNHNVHAGGVLYLDDVQLIYSE